MFNKASVLISILIVFQGCSYRVNPEYEPFLTERDEIGDYNLSESSDINLCRLIDMTNGHLLSKQIRKKISDSATEEIERRGLDCSKPFPQYESESSSNDDENVFLEWVEGIFNSE